MKTNNNASGQATPQQIGGKVYILAAARTPTGKFNGAFRTLSGPQLGAVAIKAAVAKANIPVEVIQDVYMGNVLQANEGQAPARQAALFAGLPSSVEAVTINKVCASGLKAVIFAAQNIQMGLADAQVAGGFESMSRVPYYLPRPAQGPVLGAQTAEDGLIKDGLLDVYNECLMGACADHSARQEGISRKSQDDFAIQSYRRAQKAWKEGRFDEEIAPVTIETKTGKVQIKVDEGYLDLKESRIPGLKPAFVHDGSGTITAANSSTMNDGGSAVVLVSEKLAALYSSLSHKLCQIISYADAALDPMDYSLAPAKAISIALKRASLQKEDIALWEVNEAFAAVIKITEKLLGLEDTSAKMNKLGGAIALGHPLGSSGSRILTTLVHQLKVGEYGVVGICNGGGAASAMVIQRVDRVEGAEDKETRSKL